MDSIAQSFATLVNTNNGIFKSPAQAVFLLAKCTDSEYIASGDIMGNGFSNHYECDAKGVITVRKYTKKKGFVITWTRPVEGEVSVQDAKEIKRLKKNIKSLMASIASRQASYDSGEYAKGFNSPEAAEYVFTESQVSSNIQLLGSIVSLNKFTK
jgi:hypothetical protein